MAVMGVVSECFGGRQVVFTRSWNAGQSSPIKRGNGGHGMVQNSPPITRRELSRSTRLRKAKAEF